VFAQIAADALEMPMARIAKVFHGSTDYLTEGFGSYSSRSIVMGGSAIVAAAARLRELIREAAAARLRCAPSDVAIDRGMAIGPVAPPSISRNLPDWPPTVALRATTDLQLRRARRLRGGHPKTGHVALIDYVAVEDVGRIINPLTLHGQAIGAIVQGLGGAFLEHFIYDENAQLLTGSLADYLMPTASDFPNIRALALELKPSPNNPLGAKGAGEGGIIPVGGVVANAVAAALSSLRVEPRELPRRRRGCGR